MLNWSGGKFLGIVVFALAVPYLRAQNAAFDLSVVPSINQIAANQTLVYTIFVTNTTPLVALADSTLTATMPSSVNFITATNPAGSFSSSNGVVTFDLGPLAFGQSVGLGLAVQPTVVGTFTNTVVVSSGALTVQTNVVTTVLAAATTGSLLSGSIRLSSPVAILGDDVTYGLSVTNLGPAAATGVVLSNSFSSNVLFRGVAPAN